MRQFECRRERERKSKQKQSEKWRRESKLLHNKLWCKQKDKLKARVLFINFEFKANIDHMMPTKFEVKIVVAKTSSFGPIWPKILEALETFVM